MAEIENVQKILPTEALYAEYKFAGSAFEAKIRHISERFSHIRKIRGNFLLTKIYTR